MLLCFYRITGLYPLPLTSVNGQDVLESQGDFSPMKF